MGVVDESPSLSLSIFPHYQHTDPPNTPQKHLYLTILSRTMTFNMTRM